MEIDENRTEAIIWGERKFNLREVSTSFPRLCLDQFDIEILNFPTHFTKTRSRSCFAGEASRKPKLSIFNYVSRDWWSRVESFLNSLYTLTCRSIVLVYWTLEKILIKRLMAGFWSENLLIYVYWHFMLFFLAKNSVSPNEIFWKEWRKQVSDCFLWCCAHDLNLNLRHILMSPRLCLQTFSRHHRV